MSTYDAALPFEAKTFALRLFMDEIKAVALATREKHVAIGDIPGQLVFLSQRSRAMAAQAEVVGSQMGAERQVAWLFIAKEHYRQQVSHFFQTTLKRWEKLAPPQARPNFRHSATTHVPLASAVFLYPEDYPGAEETRRTLTGIFACLADMAGLTSLTAIDELKRAAFEPRPFVLPGLGG